MLATTPNSASDRFGGTLQAADRDVLRPGLATLIMSYRCSSKNVVHHIALLSDVAVIWYSRYFFQTSRRTLRTETASKLLLPDTGIRQTT